jgi:hypothetical protein
VECTLLLDRNDNATIRSLSCWKLDLAIKVGVADDGAGEGKGTGEGDEGGKVEELHAL